MKFKKFSFLFIMILVCSIFLISCDFEKNPTNQKLFGDNSESMPTVTISDQEFQIGVVQKIAPISQDGYSLNSQAIAIKNGRIDKSTEISKIEIMIDNIQNARNYVSGLNVSDSKKTNQQELLKALDNYSTQLTDYKNLLSNEKINKENLQLKIDEVMSALDLVKQYSK